MKKNNNIEDVKKDIQRKMDVCQRSLNMFERIPAGLIFEAFPQGEWYYTWLDQFEFRLPMDFSLVKTVKEFMEIQFPEYKLEYENQTIWDSSNEAGYFLTYRTGAWLDDKAEFNFAFRSSIEGTTCILNKIGTKEIPVYEVICSEQAKEWE